MTITKDQVMADAIYDWMIDLMPNGEMLNVAVACDYAGQQRFKRALADKLAAIEGAQSSAELIEAADGYPAEVYIQRLYPEDGPDSVIDPEFRSCVEATNGTSVRYVQAGTQSSATPVATVLDRSRGDSSCICDWFSEDDCVALSRLSPGTKLYTVVRARITEVQDA